MTLLLNSNVVLPLLEHTLKKSQMVVLKEQKKNNKKTVLQKS